MKNVCIRSFSGLDPGKYGPEKLLIQTLFTQCRVTYSNVPDMDIFYQFHKLNSKS